MRLQNQRAYQKQDNIFQGKKRVLGSKKPYAAAPPPAASSRSRVRLGNFRAALARRCSRRPAHRARVSPRHLCRGIRATRYYKSIGLGIKTPRTAIEGTYVDKKCPWTGARTHRGVQVGRCGGSGSSSSSSCIK